MASNSQDKTLCPADQKYLLNEMSNEIIKFEKELNRVAQLFWQIRDDWEKPSVFSVEKACVCAAFSKIAYFEIPNFEVKQHDRAKIIPCLAYQNLLMKKQAVSLKQHWRRFLRFFEVVREDQFFTIETKYAIVVGVVTPKVIFIALRGTVPLYLRDWIIDFDVRSVSVSLDKANPTFHRGFYSEITACIPAARHAPQIPAPWIRASGWCRVRCQ